MEAAGPLIYALVKIVAYVSWCGLGARVHDHQDRVWLKAVLYGLLRLGMGAFLGLIVIVALANMIEPKLHNQVATYLIVYVPVRWGEWSVVAFLMDPGHRTPGNLFFGRTMKSRLWRLGGIVISCLADIPVILSCGGLPVGRFMC
jgi:hypothetical protein